MPTVSFTAIICGPGSSRDRIATEVSLLDGSNASRLAGVVEVGFPSGPGEAGWDGSTTDHLLLVPAGGRVPPGALDRLGSAVESAEEEGHDVDLVYVDDIGFPDGNPDSLIDPAFRPGFSPERLRAQMYLGDLVVVSRRLATEIDPGRRELTVPLPHHLALALARRARSVVHVPEVLFHRRIGPDQVEVDIDLAGGTGEPGRNRGEALAERLNRLLVEEGFPAAAAPVSEGERGHQHGVVRLEPRLDRHPPVSVVIPTNGTRRLIGSTKTVLVHHAVRSILETSTYPNYELVVVISPGGPPDLIAGLRELVRNHRSRVADGDGEPTGPSIRFCNDQRRFNFSNASNRGAAHADGEILVFLNDDIQVISPDWLERLVMYAERSDIGAVGARLTYEDGSIQHVGIWSRGGHPVHRYEGFPGDHEGYKSSLLVPQNCLAVTGACLAVSASKFWAVGGFSPLFPGSYNDVDLCLKLADQRWRTVIDPGAELVHYTASSRDPGIEDWELKVLHERWRSVLIHDVFDNPHHLAPLSDEFPPPDPAVVDLVRTSGADPHRDRRWPGTRLLDGVFGRPAELTVGGVGGTGNPAETTPDQDNAAPVLVEVKTTETGPAPTPDSTSEPALDPNA